MDSKTRELGFRVGTATYKLQDVGQARQRRYVPLPVKSITDLKCEKSTQNSI